MSIIFLNFIYIEREGLEGSQAVPAGLSARGKAYDQNSFKT
jgi:hypothetical protein